MEIGNNVSVVAPVITGTITDTEYDKDAKSLRHLVEWQDGDETHMRWFTEAQLQEVAQ